MDDWMDVFEHLCLSWKDDPRKGLDPHLLSLERVSVPLESLSKLGDAEHLHVEFGRAD